MVSSGLKKMLFFVISNTEGVRVLVCPAIYGHWMGFCGRCFKPPGRCFACILADIGQLLHLVTPTMAVTSANKVMAITSVNKIHNSDNNISHKMNGNNICHMQNNNWPISANIQASHLSGGLKHLPQKPIQCPKIAGHTNTLTPSVLDITKNNIFFRPEEAMLETGEILS